MYNEPKVGSYYQVDRLVGDDRRTVAIQGDWVRIVAYNSIDERFKFKTIDGRTYEAPTKLITYFFGEHAFNTPSVWVKHNLRQLRKDLEHE